jgi:serine-type D-Ala-D-Ala carboxypeptidase/endopeptidase (penicillin-binding protein 4)
MTPMRNSAPSLTQTSRRAALVALPALLPWPLRALARPRQAAGLAGLDRSLFRVLAGCGLPASALGLYVSDVSSGRPMASLNAEQAFVMASTAKLVTAQAALELLGPRWRWRTHAFATGPLHNGHLLGDLVIVGGGDPGLTGAHVRQWLIELRQRGLDEIRGDLVIDRSAFLLQEADHVGTPTPGPGRPHHAWPASLVIDTAAMSAVWKRWLRRGPPAGDDGPAGGASPVAQVVELLWRDVGGRLRGRLRERDLSGGRPDGARLPMIGADGQALAPMSTHLSPPLPEVVHEINKTSDNVAARHLLLSLAPGFPLRPATLPAARDRVHHWLSEQGLQAQDIEIDNGSGLSRAERSKPRALVQLLRRAWAGRQSQAFVDSLPVAGVDGTLAHRLQHGAATGQAHLKTGTLLDARALAGYVQARSGRTLAVALFVNHPQAAHATGAMDAVIEALARSG